MRTSGKYWVKVKEDSDWSIGTYSAKYNKWIFDGDYYLQDWIPFEIDETQISRPSTLNTGSEVEEHSFNSLIDICIKYVSHHIHRPYSEMIAEDKLDFDLQAGKLANFAEWLLNRMNISGSLSTETIRTLNEAKSTIQWMIDNTRPDEESKHSDFFNIPHNTLDQLTDLLHQYEQTKQK